MASGSRPERCCCSRTAASRRGRPRTTRSWQSALAALAELYVNDAFGSAHRAHATTEGVAHLLPGYAVYCSSARSSSSPRSATIRSAPLVDRARRRQGLRQARRDRPLPRLRGGDPDRRGDVLQLLQGRGRHTGELAGRGGGGQLRQDGVGAGRGAATRCSSCRGPVPRAGSSTRTRRRACSTASTCPRAGWASTSAATPSPTSPADRRAGTVFWNGPMGAFELEPFAGGREPSRRRSRLRPVTRWSAGGTLWRRCRSSAWPTPSTGSRRAGAPHSS